MLKYRTENLMGSWYIVGRNDGTMHVVLGMHIAFYVGPKTSIKDIVDFVIPYPTREAAEIDAPSVIGG